MSAAGETGAGEELLEKAEELLERIPAQDQLDKTILLANVYRRQGKKEKAEELLQNRLLLEVNEIQSLLLFLSDLASGAGLHERAGKLAEAAGLLQNFLNCGSITGIWLLSRRRWQKKTKKRAFIFWHSCFGLLRFPGT